MSLAKRHADPTDLDFIYSCLLYGARKGHYAFDAENALLVGCMKEEVQSIVSTQTLLDRRRGIASIYSLNNKRLGLLIISEAEPDSDCLEIYALSVRKNHQKRGHGSAILDDALSHYPHTDIYARCSSASDSLYRLLTARSFVPVGIDGDYRILKRDGFKPDTSAQPPCFNDRAAGKTSSMAGRSPNHSDGDMKRHIAESNSTAA